mmetsp:Transcript_9666/g.22202  ORF Transcript_9666/g.22202 Transcript_9666/m.22202 type:complete len:320 (-) Transcript_9666:4908-5867(-)
MSQKRYYYDTGSCNYKVIRPSRWDIFFDLLRFLVVSLVMAAGIVWGYTTYFDSPKEARLKQENVLLKSYHDQIQQELDKSSQVLAHLQDQDERLYRMILETAPTVRKTETDGDDMSLYQDLADKNLLLAMTMQKVDQLKQQLYIQSKSYNELQHLAQKKEKMLAAIPAIQPLSNKDLKYMSSPFGMRIHPVYKILLMHQGVDFVAPRGTPVYATGDGVVGVVKKSRGYGNWVEIQHGYGFSTRYAHMQAFNVKYGQSVTRGQCIGYVGSSGVSTSPHLHYEVLKNKKNVNPALYFVNDLDAQQYEMILTLATSKMQTTS